MCPLLHACSRSCYQCTAVFAIECSSICLRVDYTYNFKEVVAHHVFSVLLWCSVGSYYQIIECIMCSC